MDCCIAWVGARKNKISPQQWKISNYPQLRKRDSIRFQSISLRSYASLKWSKNAYADLPAAAESEITGRRMKNGFLCLPFIFPKKSNYVHAAAPAPAAPLVELYSIRHVLTLWLRNSCQFAYQTVLRMPFCCLLFPAFLPSANVVSK